jgi:hypothetical protein
LVGLGRREEDGLGTGRVGEDGLGRGASLC